ncbi:hypothetical protein DOY81_000643 [Sarcophaga bullata]|nr:hypothetical protein DOY81_000643 [Sarcophaga bullata]
MQQKAIVIKQFKKNKTTKRIKKEIKKRKKVEYSQLDLKISEKRQPE